MIFQQYYLACLSHASYLIGDETTGRAVVVDPQRDVSGYLRDAEARGLSVEYIIETHFHADFLSGHLELAAATGAPVCYGAGARAEYPIRELSDNEQLPLGEVVLEVRATPGHTPESISVVVFEHAGDEVPYGVLTGDTLFIGDVGRPDLLTSAGLPAEEMAASLYRSLHSRLLTLPDATRVFPAHGAGSACGKQLSNETSSTIGEQRRTNFALRIPTEEEFVATVTSGQPVAPAYFPYDAHLNRERRELLDDQAAPAPMTVAAVLAAQAGGATILDTREPDAFAHGHFPGAVNVGLSGRFAEYAGDVLEPGEAIVLVCDPGHATEARVRLARIGYDNVLGCLEGSFEAVAASLPGGSERSSRLTAAALSRLLEEMPSGAVVVLDVRNPGELEGGRLPDALNIPLSQLTARLEEIPRDRPVVVHCASGFRSSVAASVIARAGHGDVSDLIGGYQAWELNGRAGAAVQIGGKPAGV